MSSITSSVHHYTGAHILHGIGAWASEDRDRVNPATSSHIDASASPEGRRGSVSTGKVKPTTHQHYTGSHHDVGVGGRANGHGSLADRARSSVYGPHTTPRTHSLDADIDLPRHKDAPETNTKPEQPRNPAQQLVPMTRSSPSTDSTIHPRSRDRQFHYNHHNQHHQHPLSMPAQSGPWHPLRGVPQLNHSPPTTSNNNSMQGRTRSGSPSSLRAEYGSDIDEQD